MLIKRMLTLLVVFVFLINTIPSFAQSISVSPPRTYFNLNAGEADQKKILIMNPSKTETLELSISFNDWKYDEFGANIILEPNSLPNSCAEWIKVLPSTVLTLKPGEEKEIDIQINVPENVNQEDVHSVMMYVTQTNSVERNGQGGELVIISLQTGVKIYRRPNVGRNLDIEFIDYQYSKANNQLILKLENTGNIWAEGIIKNELINQENGKQIELDELVFYSLPKDKRTIIIKLPKDLPKGEYLVTSTFDLGEKDLLKVAELVFNHEK